MSKIYKKTDEEKIGMAVVGLGYWGPNLIRNFLNHPQVRLEVLCDQDEMRLARYSQAAPVRTSSYDQVLANPSVEVVVLATPVAAHYPMAKKALEAGKHVWLEKPITGSSKEAQDLIALAHSQKKILFVDHTFVYNSAIQKAKEIIDSGELGEIYYFDSIRINLGLLQQDVNVIWDLAPHDLSILNYLLGRTPHSVTAIGASHNTHHLEEMAYVSFLYHDGAIAHLNFNWLSPLKIRRILVGGSKKMLVYDDMESSEKIKIYDKGITVFGGQMDQDGIHRMLINYRMGDMRAPHVENIESLTQAVNHFISCILKQQTPLSGGPEGLKVVQMIEAIQMSLRSSGKTIRL